MRERLREVFAGRTRVEWCELPEATDACFAPVLTMEESMYHPHNVARATFVEVAGAPHPAPSPRFSRTVAEIAHPPAHPGEHTRAVLADWGVPLGRIGALLATSTVVDLSSSSR